MYETPYVSPGFEDLLSRYIRPVPGPIFDLGIASRAERAGFMLILYYRHPVFLGS
jgi:hypothetical protein